MHTGALCFAEIPELGKMTVVRRLFIQQNVLTLLTSRMGVLPKVKKEEEEEENLIFFQPTWLI